MRDARHMSPEFQHRLKLVLQGGLAVAQFGALAMEHMENTQAAELARNARCCAQSKREVETGGVLYPSDPVNMVKQGEDIELEKAEIALRRAQNAKKRAKTAAHKPFLNEIKASYEVRRARLVAKEKLLKEQAKAKAKEEAALKKHAKEMAKAVAKEQTRLKKQAKGKK